MEIVIGRDIETSKLRLTSGNKSVLYGTDRIPKSVRPEHCKLIVTGSHIQINNIDINSYCYVNGLAVEKNN